MIILNLDSSDKIGQLGTTRDKLIGMKRSNLILLTWYLSRKRKCNGHFSTYIPGWAAQEFTDYQFFKNFRISKEAALLIEQRIQPFYTDSIPIQKGLLITLWILGYGVSYRCAEEQVGFHYSAVCRVFNHVVPLIVLHMGDYLNYDRPAQFYEEQRIRFASRFGIENVSCVMDGTMIKTKKPVYNGEAYYSGYKKGYGISVLVVSTFDKEVLYVSAGYPASVHDSAVLRASPLWADVTAGNVAIDEDHTILGDSAFPSIEWITLSTDDIGFASPRTISEHTFAKVKNQVPHFGGYSTPRYWFSFHNCRLLLYYL